MLNFEYFVLIFAVVLPNAKSDFTVTIDCGQLEGIVISTPRGDCNVFLGVPFATPPVGQLRWEKPQPPACWSGVKPAKEFAPQCVQLDSNIPNFKNESEDCLYLNVIAPVTKKENISSALLPVMVYLHAGFLYFGSAQEYPPDGICENVATRGVIIIIIQYRLNMYGMFSTGDSTAPGNYALWDQIEALRWVKRNIASFGGDPSKVTIFGLSGGSKGVSYLTYIPAAQDLFNQSICHSGSALADRMRLNDHSVVIGKELAKVANCFGDTQQSINCLRRVSTVDLQKLYKSIAPLVEIKSPVHSLSWTFRKDGELFTEDVFPFKELGTRKTAMIGVNSIEMPKPDVNCIPNAQKEWFEILDIIFPGDDAKKTDAFKQLAKYVYIDSKGDFNNSTFVCQQLAKMQGDISYHAPAVKEVLSKVAAGSPVYVFHFDYYSKTYFPPDYPFEKGAYHSQEYCYLFMIKEYPSSIPFSKCPRTYDGEYKQVAEYLGEMWTNFAKTGNPSPSWMQWPPFQSQTSANTMWMRSNLSVESTFYLEAANFWNLLLPNLEKDFTTSTPPNKGRKNQMGFPTVLLFLATYLCISKWNK